MRIKQHIFFVLFFLVISLMNAQNSSENQIKAPGIYLQDGTKLNEYKKTFEIKGVPDPDLITLSKIDMSKYWKLMNASQRVEVVDDVTDLILILYSRAESNTHIDFDTVLVVMPSNFIRGETKSP